MAVSAYPISGVTSPTIYRATLPTSLTVITADTVWLSVIWVSNTSATPATFTLTETSGATIVKDAEVSLGNPFVLSSAPRHCVGLKVQVSASTLDGVIQYN